MLQTVYGRLLKTYFSLWPSYELVLYSCSEFFSVIFEMDAKMLLPVLVISPMLVILLGYSAGRWVSKPAGSHREANDVEDAASG